MRAKDFIHEQDETGQNLAKTKRLSSKILSNFVIKFCQIFNYGLHKFNPFWPKEAKS